MLVDLDAGAEPFVLLVIDHIVLAHGDHAVGLDRRGHRDPQHPGQVRILGEVLEVAAGDRGPVQAHTGAFQDVLAQCRRLRADDVAVGVREVRVESGGEADGHGQRRRRRARGPVAHPDTHRAVGDPEPRDPQRLDRRHVPLDPDLRRKLIHIGPGLCRLCRDGVDVDCLHGAVQLGDLLLHGHGLDELHSPLTRWQGRITPGGCALGHGNPSGDADGMGRSSGTAASSGRRSRIALGWSVRFAPPPPGSRDDHLDCDAQTQRANDQRKVLRAGSRDTSPYSRIHISAWRATSWRYEWPPRPL
jgi:hypothetical protein